jgi:hypothetical protein
MLAPEENGQQQQNRSSRRRRGARNDDGADDDARMMMSDSDSSSDDLASTSSDDSMMGMVDDSAAAGMGSSSLRAATAQQQLPLLADAAIVIPEDDEDRAYWVQRTIREAIYGRVLLAVILRRRSPGLAPNDNAEWQVTSQLCAVKEMSWQHIRKERDRLAEDPVKEVAAMQYIKAWHYAFNRRQQSRPQNPVVAPPSASSPSAPAAKQDFVTDSFAAMIETNIMMPLDLLSDDRHLYSVMPYCDGGELFERLDVNEKFSEAEARYWMHQVLNVRDAGKGTRGGRMLTDYFSFFVVHPFVKSTNRWFRVAGCRGWRICKMPGYAIAT